MLAEVERERRGLPALTINDELVPMEWFSAWAIADAVEEWLAQHSSRASGAPGEPTEATR